MTNTLDRLKALSAAATPGPWTMKSFNLPIVPTGERVRFTDPRYAEGFIFEENAALIAAMRNSIDKLLAVVEAADKLLKCIDWCEENDEYVSGYVLMDADKFSKALAALEGVE